MKKVQIISYFALAATLIMMMWFVGSAPSAVIGAEFGNSTGEDLSLWIMYESSGTSVKIKMAKMSTQGIRLYAGDSTNEFRAMRLILVAVTENGEASNVLQLSGERIMSAKKIIVIKTSNGSIKIKLLSI